MTLLSRLSRSVTRSENARSPSSMNGARTEPRSVPSKFVIGGVSTAAVSSM